MPPRDIDALAEAIAALATNPARREAINVPGGRWPSAALPRRSSPARPWPFTAPLLQKKLRRDDPRLARCRSARRISSVGAGAIAAHLTSTDPRAAELLRTGALRGMVHAAALTAVVAMAEHRDRPDLVLIIAGWCFVTGVFLFSFNLFALALTGIALFGRITPLGGASLLLWPWAALGLAVQRRGTHLRALNAAKVAIPIMATARVCRHFTRSACEGLLMTTLLYTHSSCLDHDPGNDHPEAPARC